jgi:hypothetical protein
VGITLLCCFFVFGALASGTTVLMLLEPGSPLDTLWRLNPQAREGFLKIGHAAILLMLVVSAACLTTAFGLWYLRRWGYWAAICILCINLVSDAVNAFLMHDWRTLIGIPIALLMIGYLFTKQGIFNGV